MSKQLSALILSVALAATACGGGGGGPGPVANGDPPPIQPPPPPIPPPIGSVGAFQIIDDSFVDEQGNHNERAVVQVKVGEMVGWAHSGRSKHNVSFTRMAGTVDLIKSPDMLYGDTWTFRPQVAGTYVFTCDYHYYMLDAKVIVTED